MHVLRQAVNKKLHVSFIPIHTLTKLNDSVKMPGICKTYRSDRLLNPSCNARTADCRSQVPWIQRERRHFEFSSGCKQSLNASSEKKNRLLAPSVVAGSLPLPSDDSERSDNLGIASSASSDLAEKSVLSYKESFDKIMKLGVPLMFQNVFGYLLSITCTVAIGRIGAPELAASSLANSIYVVTGLSMVLGLSTAMETFCGQAYGARNYKALGEVLQRALLVCWMACIPVALLWSQSTPLMIAVGQDPAIATMAGRCVLMIAVGQDPAIATMAGRCVLMIAVGQDPAIATMAGRYLAMCIPCVFLSIATDCMKKYLQAQGIVLPGMIATAAATFLAPAFFYVLVHSLGLGLDGAAIAFILCQVTQASGILGYILWHTNHMRGSSEATWGGFSPAAAFSKWGEYLKYGIPAMLMISLEWWIYEIAVLMNGWLPNAAAALSVGGITVTLNTLSYMIPMSLGSAVNTCVSNALGSGNGEAAKRAALMGLLVAVTIEAAMVGGMAVFGKELAGIIATDPAVIDLAARTMPVLCFLMFWDGFNAVLAGVLRGSGQQGIGAMVNGACFMVAIPSSYFLAFQADWSVMSGVPLLGSLEPVARVWMGVSAGAMLQSVVLMSLMSRWDWDDQAKRVVRGIKAGSEKHGGH
ncbi:hypothetical protein CEUSTIGMA_g7950.t1 [Chlamydomonas eustigma]|uniref:Protein DETOXIFICATION n=1 Tax=Chlamydomonas eustigma TaxID=1157962 RepID=A0A250XCC4_9CHLO|nr:hypothetical protein CEUSTIGMA_g7950.t1 [Chlamydomonas eustigma]|eukprot:GAX80512.1 hypothetical protein CEUSTIGMA_g7950.t1 [Chlamydomonas eustigma]